MTSLRNDSSTQLPIENGVTKCCSVVVKVCPKLKDTALMIGEEVWNQEGDIRDVISVSKLMKKDDGPTEIQSIIDTLTKYGVQA